MGITRRLAPEAAAPAPAFPGHELASIGEMARAFKVSQRALRFYEDRGLLSPHRNGAARLYDAGERRKLELILRGKRLGFTLTEIIGLVSGDRAGGGALALAPEQIAQQIAHLERRRADLDDALAELRAALARLPRP